MRLLTGLIHPDAGTIEVLGKPFGRRDRHRLFEVGAIIETPAFYPYLSGRENLRALAATGAPTPRTRVDEVLDFMGLHERAGDAVSSYSLGMRQRLAIAAALLSDPRLLLLDEPGNGLDPAGIVAMRDTLRHLASIGKTVFVSSHILGEVQQMADVIGIIAGGRLVREGPVRELLESQGIVRIRVAPNEVAAARTVLTSALGADKVDPETGPPNDRGGPVEGWVAVHAEHDRAASLNRALAEAGIYASGIETGSDLETLFLELTADSATPGAATPADRPSTPPAGASGPTDQRSAS